MMLDISYQLVIDTCLKRGFPSDIRIVFIELSNNPFFLSTLMNKKNKYQNVGNDLIFDMIVAVYISNRKHFLPIVHHEIDDLFFQKDIPRLVLGLHSKISSLLPIVINNNIPFVLVSDAQKRVKDVAFLRGADPNRINFISSDNSCLLNAKSHLKRNYLVYSMIDFSFNHEPMYSKLSDRMLKLGRLTQSPTIFGLSCVNSAGELTYVSKNLELTADLDLVKQNILSFIHQHKPYSEFNFDKLN